MSSGICERCGDASGERHLCVPPFLDRAPVTYNASVPPQWFPPDLDAIERCAERVAADDEVRGQDAWQLSGVLTPALVAYARTLEAENARLRSLLVRYADVIGDDARDVLPGVPF